MHVKISHFTVFHVKCLGLEHSKSVYLLTCSSEDKSDLIRIKIPLISIEMQRHDFDEGCCAYGISSGVGICDGKKFKAKCDKLIPWFDFQLWKVNMIFVTLKMILRSN